MENFENKKSSMENIVTSIEIDSPKGPQTTQEWMEKIKEIQTEQGRLTKLMEDDIIKINNIRKSLGLSESSEVPMHEYYIKPKLDRLNEEYNVASEKVLSDRTVSYDQVMQSIPTMKVPWEERVKKVENDSNLIARNAADRIRVGGMEMSDEKWKERVAGDKIEKEAFYQNVENEKKDMEAYFSSLVQKNENKDDVNKEKQNPQDVFNQFGDLFKKEDVISEEDKKFWDNYENTLTGMNETLGYKPISSEKYKTELEKKWGEKGKSKEEINEQWEKVKNNPNATWVS